MARETSEILKNFTSAVNAETRFGDLGEWRLSQVKSQRPKGRPWLKGEASKVRVRSVNWWLACKYLKLAPRITGCKRHSCTCLHWEYSLDPEVISGCKNSFASPIKGGSKARVKRLTTFEVSTDFREFSSCSYILPRVRSGINLHLCSRPNPIFGLPH
jgi:hypothetical protein